MNSDHGRRHGTGIDHISGLPDELLHDILLCLQLTTPVVAARTSVISHRWRHVWASLPDLFFFKSYEYPELNFSLDAIDGALAAYSAQKVSSLNISIPIDYELRVPARRVASWLTFASRHLVESLHLSMYSSGHCGAENEVELSTCERATDISLRFPFVLRRRRNEISTFTALTDLTINDATMDGRELEDLVSLLCPCLKNLDLFIKLSAVSNICIHSATLERLCFIVDKTGRLEIKAPILRSLEGGYPVHTYVEAPNLGKVVWDDYARQEELKFIFADSGRRLQLLDVSDCLAMAPLMRSFDTVGELKLHGPSLGTEGYQSFLNDMNYIPRCEILHAQSFWGHHSLVPSMLHLLKRANGVRKLVFNNPFESYPCSSVCPCSVLESGMADEINLSSIREIKIKTFSGGDEQMKLIDVLTSRCTELQTVEIILARNISQPSEEVYEKIKIMCGHGVKLEIKQV